MVSWGYEAFERLLEALNAAHCVSHLAVMGRHYWPQWALLDNSIVLYGSGLGDGNRHNHDDLPLLLAGKGGGTLQTGRHIVFPRRADTPMMNLFLALFDRMGVPTQRFGDSTGKLSI